MKALAINCFEQPKIIEIENTLSELQKFVGGYIESVILSDKASIICNEEAIMMNLRPNRFFNGEILFGHFLIVGINGDEFDDISDEDVEIYSEMFKLDENRVFVCSKDWNYTIQDKKYFGDSFITYDLYQCDIEETFKFRDYYEFEKAGFKTDTYKKVYSDALERFSDNDKNICEELYFAHNQIVKDRKSHSMSMSDIVVLHYKDADKYFYVDDFGFTELPQDFKLN